MKQNPILAPLANDLSMSLESVTENVMVKLYLSDLYEYHSGERTDKPARPKHMPYFGEAFKNALMAVEMGWASSADRHRDRLAAAVRRVSGSLKQVKPLHRPIWNIPQPTPRKDGDTGRVPRTGKE
mgnify:CR=1 FL=1